MRFRLGVHPPLFHFRRLPSTRRQPSSKMKSEATSNRNLLPNARSSVEPPTPSVLVQRLCPMSGKSEWKMQPDDYDYQQELARAAFADMLHDSERNRLYYKGLEAAIKLKRSQGEPVHVLDIGTGTGLLSMMAAQIGADSITAIEEFRPMAECATRVMTLNGVMDQVKLIRKRSTYVEVGPGRDMERRANILVTEVLDTELIGEGAIGTYNHAHAHLLTDDCLVVPTCATIYAQVVSSDLAAKWNRLHPLKVSGSCTIQPLTGTEDGTSSKSLALHDVQLNQVKNEWFRDISKPVAVFEFDFSGRSGAIPLDEQTCKSFYSQCSGSCDAVFMWWDIQMDPQKTITLSCAPSWGHPTPKDMAWRDHWMQAIYYPLSDLRVEEGEEITLISNHDEYSLWFDVSKLPASSIGQVPMPQPTTGIHLAVSRSRLGQINDPLRNNVLVSAVKKALRESDSNPEDLTCLCLSEQSLLPLIAAGLGAGRVFVCEENFQFKTFLKMCAEKNGMKDKIAFLENTTIPELTRASLPDDVKLDLVLAEPNFSLSILPWHNLLVWYCLDQVLSDERSPRNRVESPARPTKTMPVKAELWVVPVHYKDLWKIRAPLHTVEGGFKMKPFDDIILRACDISDENVEPHPLWEYPCHAKAMPRKMMTLDLCQKMPDKNVQAIESINLEDFMGNVNGMALWMDFYLDEEHVLSSGPVSPVVPGDKIDWDIHSKQGVFFFPNPQLCQKGISSVECQATLKPKEGEFAFDFRLN